MKKHLLVISAVLVLCLLPSCIEIKHKYQPTEFYTLEYEAPGPVAKKQLPYSIRVEKFATSPDLSSGRIIYRSEPYKREAYVYHRWRSSPAETVRYLLARDLAASGLFSSVFTNTVKLHSNVAIEGVIDEFYEWDTGQNTEAVITVSVMVSADRKDSQDRKIVLQERFSARQPCSERSASAVVAAMSKAMSEISSSLTARIYQELSKT